MRQKQDDHGPQRGLRRGRRQKDEYLGGAGKTSCSEKNMAKLKGKHTFGPIAETGSVRKRELLRDKVS